MEENVKVSSMQVFQSGFARFIRRPQILLGAYITNLLTALLLMIVPALLLIKPAYSTAIQSAADGIDFWLVQELMMSTPAYETLQALPPDWIQQGALALMVVLLVIPLFAWLPSSFLAGGTLLTYIEYPQEFSWRRFLWGCWHWFGAFLLINMLLGIVTQVLMAALISGIAFAFTTVGSWVNWITIPIFVLIATWWLVVLEYTRLFAVSNDTRNVFASLKKAFALTFRRALILMGFYGLSLLALLLVHIIFRPLLLSPYVYWLPLFLIVSQLFIAARLATRLVRWAGAVEIQ